MRPYGKENERMKKDARWLTADVRSDKNRGFENFVWQI